MKAVDPCLGGDRVVQYGEIGCGNSHCLPIVWIDRQEFIENAKCRFKLAATDVVTTDG